jgi:hypothetical protein
VSAITTELGRLSGPLAYALVAALVFGESRAVLRVRATGRDRGRAGRRCWPAAVASRCRCSCWSWWLPAIVGPLIGYEVGRRMGSRVVASRFLRRVSGPVERAASNAERARRGRRARRQVHRGAQSPDAGAGGHSPDAVPDVRRVQRGQRDRLGGRLLPARLPCRIRLHGGRAGGRDRVRDRHRRAGGCGAGHLGGAPPAVVRSRAARERARAGREVCAGREPRRRPSEPALADEPTQAENTEGGADP